MTDEVRTIVGAQRVYGESSGAKVYIDGEDVTTLSVYSEPAGATVYIDGEEAGKTPLFVAVEPGERRLMFVQEGFEDYRTTVFVRSGHEEIVELRLKKPAVK